MSSETADRGQRIREGGEKERNGCIESEDTTVRISDDAYKIDAVLLNIKSHFSRNHPSHPDTPVSI